MGLILAQNQDSQGGSHLGKNQRTEKLKNRQCMAIQNKVFIIFLPEGTENLSFGYKNLKFG
ncbi:hypothetical protein PY092_12515 [Muricauda sp. 334s03]|uniref:Uncharacterized protein n=1 Tax=Flagellimonas yonaguniensis TaxID=3031325 RepID=A0ABT5Y0K4_9FLAO|nr:hypothetical protein [[Muricauda] yonaguniensis]MDF0716977.1 hypothetical protein [[Muricauda] yonaguniensis]